MGAGQEKTALPNACPHPDASMHLRIYSHPTHHPVPPPSPPPTTGRPAPLTAGMPFCEMLRRLAMI